jgi:hypothetical protein
MANNNRIKLLVQLQELFSDWHSWCDPMGEDKLTPWKDIQARFDDLIRGLYHDLKNIMGYDLLLLVKQNPRDGGVGSPLAQVFVQPGNLPSFKPERDFSEIFREAVLNNEILWADVTEKGDKRTSWGASFSSFGKFQPPLKNFGVMLYPLLMRGNRALLIAVSARNKTKPGDSRFSAEDRGNFEFVCQIIAPCLVTCAGLRNGDSQIWQNGMSMHPRDEKSISNTFLRRLIMLVLYVKIRRLSRLHLLLDILSHMEERELTGRELDFAFQALREQVIDDFKYIDDVASGENEIGISSEFIVKYFLLNFARALKRKPHLFQRLAIRERANLCVNFAKVVRFWRNRFDNPEKSRQSADEIEQTTNYFLAVAHLVSEYACLVEGVDRHFRIEDHLREMVASQAIFYATKKDYRDHFTHTLDVCFFGLYLLKEILSKENLFDSGERLVKNWLVSSLFHDVGYVLEVYNVITAETNYVECSDINAFRDSVESVIRKGLGKLNKGLLEGFASLNLELPALDNNKVSHGIISAAHVLNILKTMPAKNDDERQNLIKGYQSAIYAMAMHEHTGKEVLLGREPLAAILKLCDEVQDWERPRIDALPFRQQLLAAVKYGAPFAPATSTMMKNLTLEFKDKIIHITLDYSRVRDPDFYIIYSWLIKSYMLQGLDLQGIIDVEITFLSKPRAGEGDMDRFKAARRKCNIWDFDNWIDFVRDSYTKDQGQEKLTITLSKLHAEQPLRVKPNKHLEKLIKEWQD